MDGRTIANFGGGCALGRQQGPIAGLRFAPLVVGPGDVDPVPTLPLRGGDHGRMEFPGVFDGGSAVAENVSDTDLLEDDAGRAEGGEPVIGVGPEPGGDGGGLADVLGGGVTVAVDGCSVGGDFEQRAVHR